MLLQREWKEVLNLLPENEQRNRNISAFSSALQENKSLDKKNRSLTEDIDLVFLVADEDKKIAILCSPTFFGGIRTRPTTIGVFINEKMTLEDYKMVTPKIGELVACTTGNDIEKLTYPSQNGAVTLPGSAAFIPAPCGRNY
eukprot:7901989-Ditylum_brightwellii.AAC.1